MAIGLPLDVDSSSLDPLPHHIKIWLRAVASLGFILFFASSTLFFILAYRLITWQLKAKRTNQFAILIFNLVLADIQQSLAFLLNVEWLRNNAVLVGTPICWAQGWFISTGDMASGVWCFAIGVHTFASVILDYRLRTRWFITAVAAIWIFVYGLAIIDVASHPQDLYVRAGAWCWVHHDFSLIRLWTHYFWIFVFEFAVVITYAAIYIVLLQRIRAGYYTESEAQRAKAISNLMVCYPLVYVVCTLPLASSRMASMSGHPPSLGRLCFSAALITSNGWLDVLLYTLTRRIMIFSDTPPEDGLGVDTFAAFWSTSKSRFGATTTIEATGRRPSKGRRGRSLQLHSRHGSRLGSQEDLFSIDLKGIKTVTTTAVTSEPAQPEDFEEMEAEVQKNRPRSPPSRYSEDTGKSFKLDGGHA